MTKIGGLEVLKKLYFNNVGHLKCSIKDGKTYKTQINTRIEILQSLLRPFRRVIDLEG